MNDKVILFFLLCGLYVGTCALEFNFVNVNLSWTEAQQFCRETYTDLATIHSTEDMSQLVRPDWYSGDAWIGLGYSAVTYLKWGYRGYYQTDEDMCLESYPNGWWSEYFCSAQQCFVCYRDLNGKSFFVITTVKTWADAQMYCRQAYTDLALIESEAENNEVSSLIHQSCNYAWIGHHDDPWKWSDNSPVPFRHWTSSPLYFSSTEGCVVEDQNHSWRPESCDQRRPFFCYKMARNTVMKVSFRSDLNMSDPKNYRLLTQKLEERINQTRIKVTWKTSPKKKTLFLNSTTC